MKKLFIAGCSYSHWYDGKCFEQTYPALIAKEYPDWHVYDASYGGSAIDGVWWRFQHLEEIYGAPDKIIVQWTNLGRHQVIHSDSNILFKNSKNISNYTFTPEPETDKFKTIRQANIRHYPNVIKKFYVPYFESYHHRVYLTQKEISLINALYGKDNVLMFDWHKYYSAAMFCQMPDNWIGSVANAFKHKKKFEKLGVDTSPHYGAEGHLEVYKWLKPYLSTLLGS